MRSKEVEESIDRIKEEYQINGIGARYSEYYSDDIETALNYIEELEKLPNKIRDKIEEYQNLLNTCNKKEDIERIKALNEKILVLKEILGE